MGILGGVVIEESKASFTSGVIKRIFQQQPYFRAHCAGIEPAFAAVISSVLLIRDHDSGDKEVIVYMLWFILGCFSLILIRVFYKSNVLQLRRSAIVFKILSVIPGFYILTATVVFLQVIIADGWSVLNGLQVFAIFFGIIWLFATLNHLILKNTHALKSKSK